MRWLLLLIAPSVAFGADFVAYDVSLRAEEQARVYSSGTATTAGQTLLLMPSLSGSTHTAETTLLLTYAPQLLLGSIQGGDGAQFLHRGRGLLEFRARSNRRVTFVQQASYGRVDLLTLATSAASATQPSLPGGPSLALQPLPTLRSLLYGSLDSEAGLEWGFDPRLKGTVTLTSFLAGGVGDSQQFLALQRRLQASAGLAYSLDRVSTVSTMAMVNRTTFSSGQSAELAQLTEHWQRHLDGVTELQLSGGGGIARRRLVPDGPATLLVLPVGEAGMKTRWKWDGTHLELEGRAALGPYVDWLSGIAYERAEGTVTTRWADVGNRIEAAVRARGAVSVLAGAQSGQVLGALELTCAKPLFKELRVEAGTRYLLQRVPQFGNALTSEWVTFISLTLLERGIL